jgi:type II secretory pathway component PulM
MVEAIRELWRAREPRERLVIAVGLGALALAVLWAHVWDPIVRDRARLVKALPTLRAQAQGVATQGAEAERLRNAARSRGTPSAPDAAIGEAAKALGLGEAIGTVTAAGEGRVQVALKPVPFDALMRLLGELGARHGLAVESLIVRAAPEPGRVQVETLTLRAGGAG